jgi:hypothetical protein
VQKVDWNKKKSSSETIRPSKTRLKNNFFDLYFDIVVSNHKLRIQQMFIKNLHRVGPPRNKVNPTKGHPLIRPDFRCTDIVKSYSLQKGWLYKRGGIL